MRVLHELSDADNEDDLALVLRKNGGQDFRTGKRTVGLERFACRPLLSAMFLVSNSIETPTQFASWVRPSLGSKEIEIHVRRASRRTRIVFAGYCGFYYSIRNGDSHSKDMLALLMQVSRIQAGRLAQEPLLTIPAR
ncbi:MAG: hypothetical protein NT107_00015 [Planctomycetota bacterium]|nr:hypothetical protein [Planctomycetota bacterium]